MYIIAVESLVVVGLLVVVNVKKKMNMFCKCMNLDVYVLYTFSFEWLMNFNQNLFIGVLM